MTVLIKPEAPSGGSLVRAVGGTARSAESRRRCSPLPPSVSMFPTCRLPNVSDKHVPLAVEATVSNYWLKRNVSAVDDPGVHESPLSG
jgi:hypothetical protein